jgi:hypothetical protein
VIVLGGFWTLWCVALVSILLADLAATYSPAP